MVDLGECRPMHARISERQCGINRLRKMFSCEKCDGLVGGKLSEEEAVATNTKKATCVKCERPNQVIFSHGRCYACSYGSGKDMTKKQVLKAVADGTYGQRGPKTNRSKKTVTAKQPEAAPTMSEGALTESMNEYHLKSALPPEQQGSPTPRSILLPPVISSPPPHKGVFLDLSDYPDLDTWLQETCNGVGADVSAAIIELLEARRAGLLEMKA